MHAQVAPIKEVVGQPHGDVPDAGRQKDEHAPMDLAVLHSKEREGFRPVQIQQGQIAPRSRTDLGKPELDGRIGSCAVEEQPVPAQR